MINQTDLEFKLEYYKHLATSLMNDRDRWLVECARLDKRNAKLERELASFQAKASPIKSPRAREIDKNLRFICRQMPDETSSLFESVIYALEGKVNSISILEMDSIERNQLVLSLKKLISYYILRGRDSSQDLELKDDIEEYCKKLEDEEFVGGPSELKILSQHYEAEFFVVQLTKHGIFPWYPIKQGKPSRRVYLFYDCRDGNKKYGVIVGNNRLNANPEDDVVSFVAGDKNVEKAVLKILKGL